MLTAEGKPFKGTITVSAKPVVSSSLEAIASVAPTPAPPTPAKLEARAVDHPRERVGVNLEPEALPPITQRLVSAGELRQKRVRVVAASQAEAPVQQTKKKIWPLFLAGLGTVAGLVAASYGIKFIQARKKGGVRHAGTNTNEPVNARGVDIGYSQFVGANGVPSIPGAII
jgi:hypothetical protein